MAPLVSGALGAPNFVPEVQAPDIIGPLLTLRQMRQRDVALALEAAKVQATVQQQATLNQLREQQLRQSKVNSAIATLQQDPEAAAKMVNADPELRATFGAPDGVKFVGKKGPDHYFYNHATGTVSAYNPQDGFRVVGNAGKTPPTVDQLKAGVFARMSPDEQKAAVMGSAGKLTMNDLKVNALVKFGRGEPLSPDEERVLPVDPFLRQASANVMRDTLGNVGATEQELAARIIKGAAALRAASASNRSGAAAPSPPSGAGGAGGVGVGAGAAPGTVNLPESSTVGETPAAPAELGAGPAAGGRIPVGTIITDGKVQRRVTSENFELPPNWNVVP